MLPQGLVKILASPGLQRFHRSQDVDRFVLVDSSLLSGGTIDLCGKRVVPTSDESGYLEYELVFPITSLWRVLRNDFKVLRSAEVMGGRDLHLFIFKGEFGEIFRAFPAGTLNHITELENFPAFDNAIDRLVTQSERSPGRFRDTLVQSRYVEPRESDLREVPEI